MGGGEHDDAQTPGAEGEAGFPDDEPCERALAHGAEIRPFTGAPAVSGVLYECFGNAL